VAAPVRVEGQVVVAQPAPPQVAARRRGLRRLHAPRALFVASGWVQNIGLIMLLFAAWQLWGTSIQHNDAQHTLRTEFQVKVHHFESTAPSPTLVSSNAQIPQPANGSVVGHLQIPDIGVDQYVVEGTAENDLSMGPGHYVGTSMPGQAGNVGIAGHRTTYGAPFNNLDHLAINDQIILTTDSGEVLTYVVSQPPFVVSPRDVSVLDSGSDNRLTLTTCNPRFSDTSRLVVVALLTQPSSASGTQVTIVPHTVRVTADDTGWNFNYLPQALVLIVLLVVLGLLWGRARRLLGRLGRVLMLTPVWLAGLYFLFEALTKLLPANL
jgi:sortase A